MKDEGLARSLQDRIADFNREVLLPSLAEACDQLVDPDQLIRIEKLELDVGTLSLDNLEQVFREEILRQFREQVTKQLIRKGVEFKDSEAPEITESTAERDIPTAIQRKADWLAYFLEYGIKPWWQPSLSPSMKELIDEVVTQIPGRFFTRIAPLLVSRTVRKRIGSTFTVEQLLLLAGIPDDDHLVQYWNSTLDYLIFRRKEIYVSTLFKIDFGDHFLQKVTPSLPVDKKKEKFWEALIVSYYRLLPDPFNTWIKEAGTDKLSVEEKEILSVMIREVSPQVLREWIKKHKTETEVAGKVKEKESEEGKKTLKKIIPDLLLEVNNAGLVLLWPYLEMFFRELDLLEDDNFKDEESTWKGVHFLHYLGFGDTPAEEQDWALNKILCGLEISEMVPAEVIVQPHEKEECEHLLQAVIRNWKVLKNTSAEGLRQAFLRRNGIIKEDANGYILEVEKTAFDVLLEKLTWPISVVRLPWMPGLIHVKW